MWEYACFFFFNDTATTEIYTLSLLDPLPIYLERDVSGEPVGDHDIRGAGGDPVALDVADEVEARAGEPAMRLHDIRRSLRRQDRKSTRLNSSHANISYSAFLFKKKQTIYITI